MVTSNRGRITYSLRDIIAYIARKLLLSTMIVDPGGGTPSNINVINILLKSTFSGLQFWQYGSVFIRVAAVASQICEITQNAPKIRIYSNSKSSRVPSERAYANITSISH